jgi:uncharacterized protein YbjT (DUF2867 family)
MSNSTAVVVGATGAVGRKLTPLLAGSGAYAKVVVLHRRPTPFSSLPRVEQCIIDFAGLRNVEVDDLEAVFCCIGTTQRAAGSTEAFQRVDRDIPVALARWAAAQGARVFTVVSSIDADAGARSVYLRTKGEMEKGVAGAGVGATYILRPSLLKGERDEFRLAEWIGNHALGVMGPVMVGPLRRFRAVPTQTLARAMLACAQEAEPGVHIVESDAILDLGDERAGGARGPFP